MLHTKLPCQVKGTGMGRRKKRGCKCVRYVCSYDCTTYPKEGIISRALRGEFVMLIYKYVRLVSIGMSLATALRSTLKTDTSNGAWLTVIV